MDSISITQLLDRWLLRQLNPDELTWLDDKCRQIASEGCKKSLFSAFSQVSRCIAKQLLQLTTEDWQDIERLCPGWFPQDWTIDRLARISLLLSLPQTESYVETVEQIFNAADLNELVTVYQALPLLPFGDRYRLRAAEGVRSNMADVFHAIALNNPYPATYFDNIAWNQMVLKAIFIGSPLSEIYGLESRNNPELSRMLLDYASERQAAHRSIPVELWQLAEVRRR